MSSSGRIAGRNGEELQPLVDVVNVRVGAVPIHGNGLGIEALGRERIGGPDHPAALADSGNGDPSEHGRRRQSPLRLSP